MSEFQEKKGKRFILDKVPVAVFKVAGKFYTYSNVCAHQKGPICKVSVDGEFIVCPWHNFQYNVKDGKGPVGFNDFIPYYQTLEKDEFVWVSLMNKKFSCFFIHRFSVRIQSCKFFYGFK